MFVVFDIETTGFSSFSDDVIQFAYARFDENNIFIDADILYFYYEGMSWSEEAYNVHHIPKEFLKQYADDFEKNLIRMWTVLSGSNVCGHNAKSFDCPFVTNWLSRFGLTGLQFGIIQDTMLAFRPMTKRPKISLINLCELNLITPEAIRGLATRWFPNDTLVSQAHNATYDVTATSLLTLVGLRKGYLSFDSSVITHMDLSEVDVSLMDTTVEKATVALPKDEHVFFELVDELGMTCNHQFVSDAEKYAHDTSIIEDDSLLFPLKMIKLDDGIYQSVSSNSTFTLRTTPAGDMFTVKSGIGELSTPQLNLRQFVEGVIERGSLHV